MRKVFVIGIGAGNPDHLTVQAIAALRSLDAVLVLDKGPQKEDLAGLRKLLCERYLGDRPYRLIEVADPVRDPAIADYQRRVEHWHEQRVRLYETALSALPEHAHAGLLVWGDPSLYDSTLRLIERMQQRAVIAFEYEVIPGITSVAALAASHRISLHRIGGTVLITTGRKLAEGWPADARDVVVMLDGECAFQKIDPEGLDIYWGAYLGTQAELLIAGALTDKRMEIAERRSEARARHGWIMDIYLLRRRGEPSQLDT